MTYGQTGSEMRAGLTALLKQHRVQQRLGGATRWNRDSPTSTTTMTEYGALIRTYRQAVLTWCHQATVAADPYLGANDIAGPRARGKNPYDFLRLALGRVLDASTAPAPTSDQLTTKHDNPLIETWRQAARAAALGEHDFHAGLGHGALSMAESKTVLKDVAGMAQALVILDHRYTNIPAWEKLKNGGWLGWTALAAGLEASTTPPDYTVDHRGWRPPLKFIRGPAKPGLPGVLQAEQNMLVRLTAGIAPINLRHAVSAQMAISTDLVTRTDNPALQTRWQQRAETYTLIHQALQDVGPGHADHGAAAARGAGHVVSRIAHLPIQAKLDDRLAAAFDARFTHVDTRIADLIETGIRNNTILRRVPFPTLDTTSNSLVKPVRVRLAPIEHDSDSDLPTLVGTRLRVRPETLPPPADAARSRADLFGALVTEAPGRTASSRPGTMRAPSRTTPTL